MTAPTTTPDPEHEYLVLENIQRDRGTGKVVAQTFWVCGPQAFLKGPLSQSEAEALADELNERLYRRRSPDGA